MHGKLVIRARSQRWTESTEIPVGSDVYSAFRVIWPSLTGLARWRWRMASSDMFKKNISQGVRDL